MTFFVSKIKQYVCTEKKFGNIVPKSGNWSMYGVNSRKFRHRRYFFLDQNFRFKNAQFHKIFNGKRSNRKVIVEFHLLSTYWIVCMVFPVCNPKNHQFFKMSFEVIIFPFFFFFLLFYFSHYIFCAFCKFHRFIMKWVSLRRSVKMSRMCNKKRA